MYFWKDETCLWTGSAFFYEKWPDLYLITNWHNVTGVNPNTKELLSKTWGKPNFLKFRMYNKINENYSFHELYINLYTDEDMINPTWLSHPILMESVDLVALKMGSIPVGSECMAVNNNELGFEETTLLAWDDVFILGFPLGLNQNWIFPIWKRGTIATEPEYDYWGKWIILVDTATRSWMSGAPVIFEKKWIFTGKNGNTLRWKKRWFLWIYSGRLSWETEFEAQLWIIWKKHLIEEIILQ